ncbi:MAG TPA: carboxymuconolactone decarboxylase family protein [Steroidobacteraceae bacterium]|nr:carboxymuconolactone decarboxylase family protein [Steroidobacteraceae bacterium]
MPVQQRIAVQSIDPEAYKPMFAMEKYIHAGSLGEPLLALVKIRASQLNGCAFCLDMHNREAREAKVPQRKLDVLAGWFEAPALYSERERAAIALTEEVTLISAGGVTDVVWEKVKASFPEKEIVQLLMAIVAINAWNRLAVSTHQNLPAATSDEQEYSYGHRTKSL